MDEFRLRYFFLELIQLAIRNPGTIGFPCSHLVEDMVIRNRTFIKRIIGDFTNSSHEYRLNNAGLKMCWRTVKTALKGDAGTYRRFECYISGDQAKDYPEFVLGAKHLIEREGYSGR